MLCPKCSAPMLWSYCESWVSYVDNYNDEVEYIRHKGYWSCDACSVTIDEDDEDYEYPENG